MAGQCCNTDCTLKGFADYNASLSGTPQEKADYICQVFDPEDCYEDIYCIADPVFGGYCPDKHYPCNLENVDISDQATVLQSELGCGVTGSEVD